MGRLFKASAPITTPPLYNKEGTIIKMTECPGCKTRVTYNGGVCPICGETLIITKEDIAKAKVGLADAIAKKNSAKLLAIRELLAASGDTESEREYAKYLERTDTAERDLDRAMDYYYSAAKKNDAFSAYRYSSLIARRDEGLRILWLKYSGVLGCVNAYPELAEYYSSLGDEETASYYYSLAARCDDTQSIVTMAKRYYDGIGVPKNEAYAKWELDKFTLPPISAIKLACRLYGKSAETPPPLEYEKQREHLVALAAQADKYGLNTIVYKIASILADNGEREYQTLLGILSAEGIGCERNPSAALAMLNTAAMNGSIEAMMYIADNHSKEDGYFTKDMDSALQYYEKAMRHGHAEAYERVGDLYRDGKLSDDGTPELVDAMNCYRAAGKRGLESASAKLEDMIQRRDSYYNHAMEILSSESSVTLAEAKSAYRSLIMSAAYGEIRAYRALGKCHAYGFGCEADRRLSFKYFRRAADNGDRDAYFSLGICYATGFGIAFSYDDAIQNFTLAAENPKVKDAAEAEIIKLKSRRAKKKIRGIYSYAVSLIYKKKYEKALEVLLSAKSIGHTRMLYLLGCVYEFGLGVNCDKKRAIEYYNLAAAGNATYPPFIDSGASYKSKILKLIKRAE